MLFMTLMGLKSSQFIRMSTLSQSLSTVNADSQHRLLILML